MFTHELKLQLLPHLIQTKSSSNTMS